MPFVVPTKDEQRVLEARGMARYYWALLRRVPYVFRRLVAPWFDVLALGLLLLAVFNRQLAGAVSDWNGISPLWGLVVVTALLAYGLLRANYEAFETMRERVPVADGPAKPPPLRTLSDAGLAMTGQAVTRRAMIYAAKHYNENDPAAAAEMVKTFRSDYLPDLLELFDALLLRGFVDPNPTLRAQYAELADGRVAHAMASYLRQQCVRLGSS